MTKHASVAALPGDVLTVQPYSAGTGGGKGGKAGGRTFLLEVKDEAASKVLLASLPLLDRLLVEKNVELRERRLEEMVDFMAGQMLVPSRVDLAMAQRLAVRHAQVLNEFGYFSANELADANRSEATVRSALADNWRKRRQVFALPHPDKSARGRDVYPAFQFEDHKPIKAVGAVLEAFGERKAPWKLALWFTSNNGWLEGSKRPVDLLATDPEAVIEAARRDAGGSAV
jgi:hypothetical protein